MGVVLVVLLVAGCATDGADGAEGANGPRTDEPAQSPARAPAKPAAAQPRQPAVFDVAVVRLDRTRAEDGAGKRVDAASPIAIDVRADQWPGRALDPALHVNGLVFRDYTFVDKHTLRFVAADAAQLTGAEVSVQYGNDVHSRVLVTRALAVPR